MARYLVPKHLRPRELRMQLVRGRRSITSVIFNLDLLWAVDIHSIKYVV